MQSNYLDSMADHAKVLLEQLESGDTQAALKTVEDLNKARDVGLYHEIGALTRSLHNAIVNFHIDTSSLGAVNTDSPVNGNSKEDEVSAMEDATDRLGYVIRLTESAANKTMDMVEETIPISEEISKTASDLKKEWARLLKRELSVEEFKVLYSDIDKFLDFTSLKTGQIGSNLSSILLAQDYQDLTGQVIKKVIDLVNEVESKLVELVTMASHVEKITGIEDLEDLKEVAAIAEGTLPNIEGEGPIMRADQRDDVVKSQDEVDDLLSSLGF